MRWLRLAVFVSGSVVAFDASAQSSPQDPPPVTDEVGNGLPPGITATPQPEPEPPPPQSETKIDETGGAQPVIDERREAAPEEPAVCTSCILIGAGTAMLIATVPLAAQLDAAIRRRDRLHDWIDSVGGVDADLGFIAGYGFARSHTDERDYAIATGVVGGAGFVVLAIGVGMVIADGGFFAMPKKAFNLTPNIALDGSEASLAASIEF